MLAHVARNEELWDAFVQQHGGGFLQSWGWSQFQEALGRTVYRFRIDEPGGSGTPDEHEDTFVQFSLLVHALPFGKRYLYVPRGPVIRDDSGTANRAIETFTVTLRQAMGKERAMFSRVEFPTAREGGAYGLNDLDSLGFEKVASVQPADTILIDLQKSEEELLAEMHQKTRYNIRVAERHGVQVATTDHGNAHLLQHDIDVFWRMLSETASRDTFHTHPKDYYATMIDVLSEKKRGAKGMRVKLAFASHNGKAVAAGLFGYFGDTVTYLHGASLSEDRKVMAPYLLHWQVMRDAKRDGFRTYDLWGVAPDDMPSHKWAGITRFKRGFGGRRVGYIGAWELPNGWFWYMLYGHAKRFRNL